MIKDSPQPWGLCVWEPVGEKPSPSVHLGHCPFLPVWVGVGGICDHFLSGLFPFPEAQA